MGLREKFSYIYTHDYWRGPESRSGVGSGLAQTVAIRRELPRLIKELGVQTILDAPCGDYHWMAHTPLGVWSYIGVDIVPEMIEHNRRFEGPAVKFLCADITKDPLPRADLILCRDGLVHLTYADAWRALENFKRSGTAYLLVTTFWKHLNGELKGLWRPLNLQLAPFDFPPPIQLIDEQCRVNDGVFDDDCLGLWRLIDIPWRDHARSIRDEPVLQRRQCVPGRRNDCVAVRNGEQGC